MDFAFKKINYVLLIIGVLLIATGIFLMVGGGSEDPNMFSDAIFNSTRMTIAPIFIMLGFIVEFFAIMIKK